MRPIFLFGSFLLCLSLVSALYTPSVDVTSAPFTAIETLDPGAGDYVYSIALAGHPHVTVSLSGMNGYLPKLYLFDPVLDDFIFQANGKASETLSFTYTPSMVRTDQPQEIYAIVVNFGDEDQGFNLTVLAESQDDAGMGMDAPKRFSDGLLIEPGEYRGFLGGGDLVDQYAVELEQGETVSFKITPDDDTAFTFKLVDHTLFTKVDTGSMLVDGASLETSYTSQVDQTVFFGIEGGLPYTLLVTSDMDEPEPTPIPPPVTTVPEPTPVPDPVVTVDPVEDAPVDEDTKGIGLLLMIIAIVLLVVLGVAMFLRKKKEIAKDKKKK